MAARTTEMSPEDFEDVLRVLLTRILQTDLAWVYSFTPPSPLTARGSITDAVEYSRVV